jgi:hypothetical protein
MKTFWAAFWLLGAALSATFPTAARTQGPAGNAASGTSASVQPQDSEPTPAAKHVTPGSTGYVKPTQKQKFRNYLFDSFGPYPWLTTISASGIQQWEKKPPEWGEGWDAYGVRVASGFGISLVATTTRYGLAEVFREDTIYYRCECTEFFPRVGHALISTVTSLRGDDGHRAFSFPKIAAPYAGTMTAELGWFPSRYEPMDGFRMGNYMLLDSAGINLAKEFIWGGPHTLMARTPLKGITQSKPKD